MRARLEKPVTGQRDWTQAIFGAVQFKDEGYRFVAHRLPVSRLQSMAAAQGLLLIPEGISEMPAGDVVNIRLMSGY